MLFMDSSMSRIYTRVSVLNQFYLSSEDSNREEPPGGTGKQGSVHRDLNRFTQGFSALVVRFEKMIGLLQIAHE